jgi:hypothetical protein
VDRELLSRYFDGELTESERARVESYLSETDLELLDIYKEISESVSDTAPAPPDFAKNVMARVKDAGSVTETVKTTANKRNKFLMRYLPIAACLVFVVGVALFLRLPNAKSNAPLLGGGEGLEYADDETEQAVEYDGSVSNSGGGAAGADTGAIAESQLPPAFLPAEEEYKPEFESAETPSKLATAAPTTAEPIDAAPAAADVPEKPQAAAPQAPQVSPQPVPEPETAIEWVETATDSVAEDPPDWYQNFGVSPPDLPANDGTADKDKTAYYAVIYVKGDLPDALIGYAGEPGEGDTIEFYVTRETADKLLALGYYGGEINTQFEQALVIYAQ